MLDKLREAAATGLDMSPGDPVAAWAVKRITALEYDIEFVKSKLTEYVASNFDPGMMAPTLDDLWHHFNIQSEA